MEPIRFPKIKVCCISSVEEAQTAVRHGADALGLVSAMPSGPGVIGEALIAEIAASVPPPVATFLLTSHQDPDRIIEQQRTCRVNTLQLVDRIDPNAYALLRTALPGVKLVQVIHVTDEASITEAETVTPFVDAVLLDSGNPSLPVKELGGTGRLHDWRLSTRIRERISKPVFLAGGLRPENVEQAIQQVQPYGLDLCNGVRTEGRLDPRKLKRFFASARRAQ